MFMKKISKAIALLLVAAAVVFAAGCAEKTATPLNVTNEKGQVVTGIESGKTISLNNGESFTLNLVENPSTGYAWELNLSKGLSILNDNYRDPSTPHNMGAAGTHSWVIHSTAPGSQQVKGIYKGPTGAIDTVENFTLTVKVV